MSVCNSATIIYSADNYITHSDIGTGIDATVATGTQATTGLFIDKTGNVNHIGITNPINVANHSLYLGGDLNLNDSNVSGIGVAGIVSNYANLVLDTQFKNLSVSNSAAHGAGGLTAGFAYFDNTEFNGTIKGQSKYSVYSKNSNAYGFIFSTGYPNVTDLGQNATFEIDQIDVSALLSGSGFQAGNQRGGKIDINNISLKINGGDGDSYGWGVLLKSVNGEINIDTIKVETANGLVNNMTENKNSAYGFAATNIDSNGIVRIGAVDVTVGNESSGKVRGIATGVDIGATETNYTTNNPDDKGTVKGTISVDSINVKSYSTIDPAYGLHIGNDNNASTIIHVSGSVKLKDINVTNEVNGVGTVAGIIVATGTAVSDNRGIINAGSLILDGKITVNAGNGTATAYGIYAGQISLLNIDNSITATGGNNTESYGIYTTGNTKDQQVGGLNSNIVIRSNVAISGGTASVSLNSNGDSVKVLAPIWNNGNAPFILQGVEFFDIGNSNQAVTASMIAGSHFDSKTNTTINKKSKLLGSIQSEGSLNMNADSSLGIQLSGGSNGRAGTYFSKAGAITGSAKFFITDTDSFLVEPVTVFGSGLTAANRYQLERSINRLAQMHGIVQYEVIDDGGVAKIMTHQTATARLSDVYLNTLFMHAPFMRDAVENHIADRRHPRQVLSDRNGLWVNYVGRSSSVGSSYIRYEDAKITSNGIQTGLKFNLSRLVQYGIVFGYEDHALSYNISREGREAMLNATEGSHLLDADKVDAVDFYVGVFSVHQFDFGSDLRFYLGAGSQDYKMNRYELDKLNTSNFSGRTFESSIEYGYRLFAGSNISLRPVLSIDYRYNKLDNVHETDGYNFADADLSQLFLRLGTDAQWQNQRAGLHGGIYYSRQVLNKGSEMIATAQGSRLVGIDTGDSILNVNIGARFKLTKLLTVFGSYNAEIYSHKNAPTQNTGNIGLALYW
ncbi:MAG: autotransporter outer membrane beta-barrel domain-containing protein [Planctomycetaceae bacterium]|nr:autotransporter outer membrane beta-barrel domain-containing protein [Planctomycetaceae bacterium]